MKKVEQLNPEVLQGSPERIDEQMFQRAYSNIVTTRQHISDAFDIEDEQLNNYLAINGYEGKTMLPGDNGTGKTTLAKMMARFYGGTSSRINGTPSTEDKHIKGTFIYHPVTGEEIYVPGVLDSNFAHIDEFHRMQEEMQNGAIEGMEEGIAVIGVTTIALPKIRFITASINLDGGSVNRTLRDRFDGAVYVTEHFEEDSRERAYLKEVMLKQRGYLIEENVLDLSDIAENREVQSRIYVSPAIRKFANRIIQRANDHDATDKSFAEDSSLRGTSRNLSATLGIAQGLALGEKKLQIEQKHVKQSALSALGLRIVPTIEAEQDGVGARQIVRDAILAAQKDFPKLA